MDSAKPPKQAHSAEYFGEQRDYWWDHDFVSLLLRGWGLTGCRNILDVGCGVGHWGRVLLPHLPADATLTGIDRESQWVERAGALASERGFAHRARYAKADVQSLPFSDGEFDLVTCQTLLIHVADCRAVIRELCRVLKPGGCLLVAEPNNLASTQIVGSARFDEPIDQRLAMTRFQLTCERGKAALGEGNNSVGELIPGLFAESGLTDIRVCQSSRASPLIPPYRSAAERALRDQILDWASRDFWIWSKADTTRYFLAGGGEPADFAGLWSLAMRLAQEEASALRAGTLHSAGGNVFYLVAGWKPALT